MLTRSRETDRRAHADRSTLIGSSLGGVRGRAGGAAAARRVDRLVLLAPALDFGGDRLASWGTADWRRGERPSELNVFHYGYGRMMPVHYELYADARSYDASTRRLTMPVQVFQGRRDTAVDPATVGALVARHGRTSSCTCSTMTISCTGSLDYIWRDVEPRSLLRAALPADSPIVRRDLAPASSLDAGPDR